MESQVVSIHPTMNNTIGLTRSSYRHFKAQDMECFSLEDIFMS